MLPLEIENRKEEIRKEIERSGAELVDMGFRKTKVRSVVTIIADRPGGITLDECAAINHALSSLFDGLIEGSYFLEVNSPGLDRPIKSEKDFVRAVGEMVRVIFKTETGATAVQVGRILSPPFASQTKHGDKSVKIRLAKDGSTLDLSMDSIVRAVREIKI